MIILDTDTLSIAQHPDSREALTLHRRVLALPKDVLVATTIISYEEQTRGWLAYFAKSKTKSAQINAYLKLLKHLDDWRRAHVLPFDDAAANALEDLQKLKLRIGSYDLKIAAIALRQNATLLTRNLQDFRKVPNLHAEDWTKA